MKGAGHVNQAQVPEGFVTAYEAAERMGYHPDRLKFRIRNGEIPSAIKGPKNAWWLDPSDLDRLENGKGRSFWEKVDKSEDCWLWTGRLLSGYGIHAGRLAHRLSYEEHVGKIPDGMELDHLCFEPRCVRPDHLEPVTRLVNMRRRFDRKTHCKHGHEFTPENTYLRDGYYRTCRRCTADAQHRYQKRKTLSAVAGLASTPVGRIACPDCGENVPVYADGRPSECSGCGAPFAFAN